MKTITIKLDEVLMNTISSNARQNQMTDEEFIKNILSRFTIDKHIMDSVEVELGYQECGEMNIKIAEGD